MAPRIDVCQPTCIIGKVPLPSRDRLDALTGQAFAFLRIAVPVLAFCAVPAVYNSSSMGDWPATVAEFLRTVALVGFGVFPLGAYFVVDGLHNLLRTRSAEHWPTTKGLVTASRVGDSYGGYGAFWHAPRVSYRYEVAGVPFEGELIQTARLVFSSESDAAEVSARYPVSAEVTVRYDPRNPEFGILDLGRASARREIVVGLCAIAAPFVLGALITRLNSLGG